MLRFFRPFGVGEEFGIIEYADGDSGTYFFPEFGGVSDVGGGGLERQAFPTSFTPIHEPYFDTAIADNYTGWYSFRCHFSTSFTLIKMWRSGAR